jgi:hypothetical protein
MSHQIPWARFIHLSSKASASSHENTYTIELEDEWTGVEVVEMVTCELSPGTRRVREGANALYFSEECHATFRAELPVGMYTDDDLLAALASAMACASVVRGDPVARPLNAYTITTRGRRVVVLSNDCRPFSLHTYTGRLAVGELTANGTHVVTMSILASTSHVLLPGAPLVLSSPETGEIELVVTGRDGAVTTTRARVPVSDPGPDVTWRLEALSTQSGIPELIGSAGPDLRCRQRLQVTSTSAPIRVDDNQCLMHVTCTEPHGGAVDETVVDECGGVARVTSVPSEHHLVMRSGTGVGGGPITLHPPRVVSRRHVMTRGSSIAFVRLWLDAHECRGCDRPSGGSVFARARFQTPATAVTLVSSADYGIVGVWSIYPPLSRVRRLTIRLVDENDEPVVSEWTMMLRVAGRKQK